MQVDRSFWQLCPCVDFVSRGLCNTVGVSSLFCTGLVGVSLFAFFFRCGLQPRLGGPWCCATCCSWNSCSTRICAAYSLCVSIRCGLRHWSFDTCLVWSTHRDGVAAVFAKDPRCSLDRSINSFFLSFSFFFFLSSSLLFSSLLFSSLLFSSLLFSSLLFSSLLFSSLLFSSLLFSSLLFSSLLFSSLSLLLLLVSSFLLPFSLFSFRSGDTLML